MSMTGHKYFVLAYTVQVHLRAFNLILKIHYYV